MHPVPSHRHVALCVAAVLGIAGLWACADSPSSPASPQPPANQSPSSEIKDATHSGGKQGFYFLPPMVAAPVTSGVFDATLSPRVVVCEWAGTACGPTIADFSTGTTSNAVRVDAGSQLYIVNWDTKTCITGPCTLDNAKTYRLTVLVNSIKLGHADFDLVASGSDLRNVATNDYVGLVDGRTLPVKFRVEQGVVAGISVAPDPVSVTVGETVAFTATVTDLHGNALSGFPVIWSTADAAIATVSSSGVATGVGVGSVGISAAAESESASATLSVVPAGPQGVIALIRTGESLPGSPKNDLFVMNADGSNLHVLAPTVSEQEEFVDLSPDRSTVVFGSTRTGSFQIFSIRTDGTDFRQLTNMGGHFTRSPKWSPDGNRIAFQSPEAGGNFDIYIMNADGTGKQRITTDPATEAYPTWSPDGSRIVFSSNKTGVFQLWARTLATGVEEQVTFDGGDKFFPMWAPTGTWVSYVNGNRVWKVNVGGGTPAVPLTPAGNRDGPPTWSPDGSQLLFGTDRAGTAVTQLFIMNADGTGLQRFRIENVDEGGPSWR